MQLLALTLATTAIHAAEPHRVLIELYTSEGCNSCPPAEALLRERPAALKKALVLTWHVDYWDYLGWTDTYGQRAHTERQRRMVRTRRLHTLVTPQFTADGEPVEDVRALEARVRHFETDTPKVALGGSATLEHGEIRATVRLTRLDHEIRWPEKLRILPVLVAKQTRTRPAKGENTGTELTGINVALCTGTPIEPKAALAPSGVAIRIEAPKIPLENLTLILIAEDAESLDVLEAAELPIQK